MCMQPSRQGLGGAGPVTNRDGGTLGGCCGAVCDSMRNGEVRTLLRTTQARWEVAGRGAVQRGAAQCRAMHRQVEAVGRWKVQAGQSGIQAGMHEPLKSLRKQTYLWPGLAATPSLSDPWKPSEGRRAGWRCPRRRRCCPAAAAAARAAARPQSAPSPRAQSAELPRRPSIHAAVRE